MSEAVILKSNRYGIQLHLDPELPFEELKEKILAKFVESEKFFRDASFAITFDGRELTEDEENSIVEMINEKTSTHVVCIVEEDEIREEILKRKTEAETLQINLPPEETVHPHEAIVRMEDVESGEMLIVEQNLVIYGSVDKGATVTSKGSITVLGELRGNVWAGAGGAEEDVFVMALVLEPESLRLGPVMMASGEEPHLSFRDRKKKSLPRIAKIKGGMVTVEPYEREK